MLSFINQERALVGVPPLTWNNTLATDAQTYADYLEVTGKNDHPSAEWVAAHPMAPDGENLLAGGGGDLSPTGLAQQAFNAWLSEKVRYFGQPLPCKMYPQLRRSVITHKWYGKALPKLVAPAITGPNDPTYNVPTFRISCRFTRRATLLGSGRIRRASFLSPAGTHLSLCNHCRNVTNLCQSIKSRCLFRRERDF